MKKIYIYDENKTSKSTKKFGQFYTVYFFRDTYIVYKVQNIQVKGV